MSVDGYNEIEVHPGVLKALLDKIGSPSDIVGFKLREAYVEPAGGTAIVADISYDHQHDGKWTETWLLSPVGGGVIKIADSNWRTR